MSLEWTTTSRRADVIDPSEEFADDYGSTMDPGNYGIHISSGGDGDGALVEGTIDDLIAWTERLLSDLREAKTEVEPEVADPDTVATILQRADLGTCLTVYRDGTVTTAKSHHAPEVFHSDTDDVEIYGEGWTPLTGLTGQHGYNGAVMHASEFIGRGVAQAVLDAIPDDEDSIVVTATTVEVFPTDDDPEPEPAGWAILTRPYSTGE